MRTSAAWIRDTPVLACLAGLGHRDALQKLRRDPAARAAMHASPQWIDAQRWAERWAGSDRAYERAFVCGFAAQHDVQVGVLTLAEAERWAIPPTVRHVSYRDWRAAAPIRGADLGPAAFATDWIAGWMRDLERHILPAPATPAAREILTSAGSSCSGGWVTISRGSPATGWAVPTVRCAASAEPGRRSRRPGSAGYRPTRCGACTWAAALTAISRDGPSASFSGSRADTRSSRPAPCRNWRPHGRSRSTSQTRGSRGCRGPRSSAGRRRSGRARSDDCRRHWRASWSSRARGRDLSRQPRPERGCHAVASNPACQPCFTRSGRGEPGPTSSLVGSQDALACRAAVSR